MKLQKRYIILKLLILWISLTLNFVLSEIISNKKNVSTETNSKKTIKGYFYNIFPKNIDEKEIKKIIISHFETVQSILFEGKNNDIKLEIEISPQINYTEYKSIINNEIKSANYHFFLIKLNTLFGDYQKYKSININNKEDKSFYLQTIPINGNNLQFKFKDYLVKDKIELLDYNIMNDCKLNEKYYALPFSSSYNFLFYNKYLLNAMGVEEKNIFSYNDIDKIIKNFMEIPQTENYNKYILSLNEKEKVTSFFLEGLYANSPDKYSTCVQSYGGGTNRIFNHIKCNGEKNFFYENDAENWFKRIKQYFDENIIPADCFNYSEEDAYETFNQGTTLFFKGNSESYFKFINNNMKLSNLNEVGAVLLPESFSTYDSYVLIGNNHENFEKEYESIVKTMTILVSDSFQTIKEQSLQLLPSINYKRYKDKNKDKDGNTLYTLLSKIKPLSLTRTLFNNESNNNNNSNNNVTDENLNKLLSKIKSDLNISYIKYNSTTGFFNIMYFITGILFSLILVALVIYYKDSRLIKKASPKICVLFIIGNTSFFFVPIFNIGIPNKISCTINHYFIHLLLSIALSAYLIRIWRIISNSKTKKIAGISVTDNSLNRIITFVISVQLVLNILWDSVSPRDAGIIIIRNDERITNCSSINDSTFKGLTIIINILLVNIIL
ncbi:hypothetical protein BCR36DRAFT_289451 [Piromyces finnis]|uniref:G-protein coupled receptors family 3 profile domain-containing protein n=1 Tax=Piromyces finnis TaxID=1754191 RepID=A0A1Y1V9Z0_9FUNG|nr:hypothetical protein BCR36DRAFT_289451 [Piromyces finnis]|eukprot:ORX50664.1 hypothetical protein BCR36DRAFT_289451 [Piromyces finnis]